MIEKNPKVKKFDLVFDKKYEGHTQYRVVGLTKAYHGPGERDYATGCCGLIKQKQYPGYCQLCFVYHTDDSENFSNGCTVEFMPLMTENGERILVKYDHDCLLCFFDQGNIDYDRMFETGEKVWMDGTISFIDNGYCELWDEDESDILEDGTVIKIKHD